MTIPIIISVRGIFLTSILIAGLAIFVILNNSKEKSEYNKVVGTIEYYGKEFQNLPVRNKGDFRYLKIDQYPYIFEIYEPNSLPTKNNIDDLKLGDNIDIYYYETSNTIQEQINRFTQFIDKDQQPYFIRSKFQEKLGYIIIALCLLLNIISYFFWKNGKLKW